MAKTASVPCAALSLQKAWLTASGLLSTTVVLEVARLLVGMTGIVALSAGSDGIDGNSPAAGAVVDSTTWSRALEQGIDPRRALDDFDTYPLFAALGDALVQGPSGNNVRDIRMLLMHVQTES